MYNTACGVDKRDLQTFKKLIVDYVSKIWAAL